METVIATARGSTPSARTTALARWYPTRWSVDEKGSYRLAPSVADRLRIELKELKNRDAAHALAVFLARFHATPKRMIHEPKPFVIDRRALANRKGLDLSEDQIRGAVKALLRIGYLAIVSNPGTVPGRKLKVPTKFEFNGWYKERFAFLASKANSPKYRDTLRLLESTTREALHLGDFAEKKTRYIPKRKVFASPPTRVECYDPRAETPDLSDALNRFAAAFRSRHSTSEGLPSG